METQNCKSLTRRQKESMQVLMQALTDFVLEDRYEAENLSDYDSDEERPEKRPGKKATPQRLDENDIAPKYALVPSTPPDGRVKENLANSCDALMRESVTLEYSLRTLGAGGPGMYGACVLRRKLRAFKKVVENCRIDELYRGPGESKLAERYTLGCFIDELPGPLDDLRNALDELQVFLLDFVPFFHSIDLTRVLNTLKSSLEKQHQSLEDHRDKNYISPAESQELRSSLLSFFSELEKSFQICSAELSEFRKQGIPLIRTSQNSQSDRYLMLTTISTFFSAVTSATLQIAFQEAPGSESTVLGTAVNTFFFSSLIFSTASAVQALLAMAWHRSFIRAPEEKWAFQWVSKSPLLYLVISGVFFAIGLCLFVIASQKDSATTFFTVTFAFVHAIGMIAMSVWFLCEQWRFRRQTGVIGRKLTKTSVTMSLLAWVMNVWQLQVRIPLAGFISRSSQVLPRWHGMVKARHDIAHNVDDIEKCEPGGDTEPESVDFAVTVQPPSRPESVISLPNRTEDDSSDPFTFNTYYRELQTRHSHDEKEQNEGSVVVEASETLSLDYISGEIYGSDEDAFEDNDEGDLSSEMAQPSAVAIPEMSAEDGDTINRAILGTALVEEPSFLGDYGGHARPGPSTGEHLSEPAAQRALPVPHEDLLTVRKETWERDLRQESISYMEMYNRRNPKKKRTYPPFEPPSPY